MKNIMCTVSAYTSIFMHVPRGKIHCPVKQRVHLLLKTISIAMTSMNKKTCVCKMNALKLFVLVFVVHGTLCSWKTKKKVSLISLYF